MNIITLEQITKVYTERKLFDQTDFFMQEGEKIGVVGINGTGKSTLLRILAGEEVPDEGKVVLAGHLVVKYLPQHPNYNPEDDMLSCIAGNAQGAERVEIETKARTMLTKLGITNFDQKAGELSGGQLKRVALVETLLAPADVLLLDEPTNHLDYEMTEWLEETLRNFRGSIIMVTHDRYFLDSVCNRIIELDKGKIYSYQENYSGFLQLKAEREEMELASHRKLTSLYKTELAWIKRGARARTTKQKFRVNRFEELKNAKAPETDGKVELGSITTRMGRTTVELEHIYKAYGERVLIRDFSYIFLKNDRIGIVGANGCGKTTLMKIIAGRLEADAGKLTIGQTIKIGYYSQMIEDAQAQMKPEMRVIDYIKEVAEYVLTTEGKISATRMLEKFLFPASMQYAPLQKLSGGEKRRLILLRVLMESPNVLLLDEPTNDLDITTLTILEDYLDQFQGIVVMVSHDRYFLDRTVDRIFAFQSDGSLRQYEGGYTDYMLKRIEEGAVVDGILGQKQPTKAEASKIAEEKEKSKEAWKQLNAANRKRKFTFQEQRDYETIEDEIAKIEDRLVAIDDEMSKCASDFVKLNKLTQEKEEMEQTLEEKMDRWMYLEQLAEEIGAPL
ncbi:MAG: ABC-F family ATP-binding cassette domain-containing protein [Lachnospiraceae bacterium]|nr:ABC-F family ATP-binding cassette domain-containing protein [Lachnospiraceae bacterium]